MFEKKESSYIFKYKNIFKKLSKNKKINDIKENNTNHTKNMNNINSIRMNMYRILSNDNDTEENIYECIEDIVLFDTSNVIKLNENILNIYVYNLIYQLFNKTHFLEFILDKLKQTCYLHIFKYFLNSLPDTIYYYKYYNNYDNPIKHIINLKTFKTYINEINSREMIKINEMNEMIIYFENEECIPKIFNEIKICRCELFEQNIFNQNINNKYNMIEKYNMNEIKIIISDIYLEIINEYRK